MTLKTILPSQARPLLTRALDLPPHAAVAVASTSVVIAEGAARVPAVHGSQPAMTQLLSDTLLRIFILDSLGGRVDTSLP